MLFIWNVQNKQSQGQKINSGWKAMGGGELRDKGFLFGVMEIFWNYIVMTVVKHFEYTKMTKLDTSNSLK